jgi:hypothetical protein
MAQAQQASQPNRRQPKPYKPNRFAHTANTKYGMGDSYGMGVKAKLGRIREDTVGMVAIPPKKLKTPPKSLA